MTAEQKASLAEVIWVDPERVSGTPCFTGTRVPAQNFVDHLEGGATHEEFLRDFPSVSRTQLIRFIELATEQLIECVSS